MAHPLTLPITLAERLDTALLNQRGYLFPWAAVFFGTGVGAYFALPFEPEWPDYAAIAIGGGLAACAAWRWPGGLAVLGWALALMAAGFCIAGARAHDVSAPVLNWRYYGPVEGRIVAMDRSASDRLRITLDQVVLKDISPQRRPERVRLSLQALPPDLQPGARVMTTAHLSPPGGAVEPGGFDFRRHAWFLRLGAVGYTRVPVLTVAPPDPDSLAMRIFQLRMAASARVRAILPGDVGGVAAAVTSGDRSGISQEALEDLRASNLAHLLAISGLHMGLLAGFVFGLVRVGLAAVPVLALRWPVRKIAALTAMVAAAGYLALSGGNVATERAFIMVAVALTAVLFDRRALSLRSVAMAALIVLMLRPEALTGPGFQMSFAATTALVAIFTALRGQPRLPGWLAGAAGVFISSAVAGLATSPVGAAHFNTMSHYGLPANLVSVPLMGSVVIPAAVVAAVLAPFGWEGPALHVMGWGLSWILGVAEFTAGLPGAQGFVAAPPGFVLPLLAFGALVVVLWHGPARWVGLLPAAAAFGLWSMAERPAILIAEEGVMVGVMTDGGRALSKPRGAGFVTGVWLENDGDGVDQVTAAARWPGPEGGVRRIDTPIGPLVHVTGKRALADLASCARDEIVVAPMQLDLRGGCTILDPPRLRQTGSIAISQAGQWTYAAATPRLWSGADPLPPLWPRGAQ